MEKNNESFGSRFGFIMTAAGFSMGLGNIWRFPYLVGTQGGGAFVIIFILIALLIGIPLFTMEMGLGRKGQASPIMTMRKVNGEGSKWNAFGWLGVISAYLIMTYYMQIMGWIVNYLFKTLRGVFAGLSSDQIAASFASFREDWVFLLILTIVCILLIGFISSKGLEDGVEQACKFMMPALFLMLIFMAIRSLTLDGGIEGFKWFISPDFSKIGPNTFLVALGQVFFSIGIACGGALVYGSYLDKDSDIITDGFIVVSMDTIGALLAGTIIFPAIFSYGLETDQGPGLLFVTMSNVFTQMPGGRVFGVIFYLLVFFAATSSALGYLEPVSTTIRDVFKVDRKKATWIALVLVLVGSIPAILSEGPLKDVSILGMSVFDFDDFLSGNILMPLGAIILSLYVIFKWKFDNFQDDINIGTENLQVGPSWKPLVYVIIPVSLIVIFVSGLVSVIL